MPCNSTGGGGSAAMAAPSTAQSVTFTPQNAPWDSGDNDGYRNLGHANTDAGKAKIDQYFGSTNGGATDQWVQGLTSGEKSGTVIYTGSSYMEMNDYLRSDGATSISSKKKTAIQQTEDALKKGVLEQPTIFHRGSSAALLGGATTVDEIQAMVGQTVIDKGFVSSAATTNVSWGGTIKYHIKTPAGTGIGAYVRPISQHKGEMEFLFQRKSEFRVVGAYKDNQNYINVNLEYVGNYV